MVNLPRSRVWILSNIVKVATLQQFFLSSLYLFDSIFSGSIWTDKLHNYVEAIFIFNGCYGNGKDHCFSYHNSKSCKDEKILHQRHGSYPFELLLIKLSWLDTCKARKNVITSKRYILRTEKLKDIFTFYDYLSKFFP